MRVVHFSLLILLMAFGASGQEDRRPYPRLFEEAAREFGVPADVLKGIAFAETRWAHLTWAPGDTAGCNGMPRPYGIMSLWDNDHFGHSLPEAARLIDRPVEVLKADVRQNIRGAAALLRKIYAEQPIPPGTEKGAIESWRNAIAAYCGIPQADLAQRHALDVYAFMHRGYRGHGIEWPGRRVALESIRSAVLQIEPDAARSRSARTLSRKTVEAEGNAEPAFQPAVQPDYPGAIWRPAYPGHWYTSGNGRHFVVIHDMEGYYLSTISYFQQSNTQASAHYCINGLKDSPADAPAGEITQMVEERHYAWHARCLNTWSIGIEHEGFVNNPAWYTEAQYQASAALTRYLCDKYDIPKDRNHIIAHGEWQNAAWRNWMAANYPAIDSACNNHTDPGPNWAWTHYMELVTRGAVPSITSQPASVVRNPGEAATFAVAATGTLPLQFQWHRDGAALPGATNASLLVTNIQLGSAGGYFATVSNPVGWATSLVATLNVTAPSTPVGHGSGLLGGYFDRDDFSAAQFSRVDQTVNFNWGTNGPAFFMGDDTFSIRWLGEIEPRYSQTYQFHLRGDDRASLWIEGEPIIEQQDGTGGGEARGSIHLEAGRRYALRLDYAERNGNAHMELRWSSASQVKQVVPRSQLYPPALTVQAPASVEVDEETLLAVAVVGPDPDPTAGSSLWGEYFERFVPGTANGSVLFRAPSFSGSTDQFLDGSTNDTTITDVFPGGHLGERVLQSSWSFASNGTHPWLRLTTASAPWLPNPAMELGQAVQFDVWTDRPLGVALGIRETGNEVAPGEDGGTVGSIEFVGATTSASGSPQPIRTVLAGNWTTLQFNVPREVVSGFTGNGVLDSDAGPAVLEHLALVPADGPGRYTFYLDNLAVVRANSLTYSITQTSGTAASASIGERSGRIEWLPREADGPGTNRVTVRVTNQATPPMTVETNLWIVVNEVNRPPSINSVSNRLVHAGEVLTEQIVASDFDLPTNELLFTLVDSPFPDLGIDPGSGRLQWTIPSGQAPANYRVTVAVADDGAPPLAGLQAFDVTVVAALRPAIRMVDGVCEVQWNSIPGRHYQLQSKENLSDVEWTNRGENVLALEAVTIFREAIPVAGTTQFYRVLPAR